MTKELKTQIAISFLFTLLLGVSLGFYIAAITAGYWIPEVK